MNILFQISILLALSFASIQATELTGAQNLDGQPAVSPKIDTIRTLIPEPGIFALIGTAGFLFLFRRRSTRRR